MSTMSSPLTFAQLFKQLNGAMKVQHGFGDRDDASQSVDARFVWTPVAGPSAEKAPFDGDFQEYAYRQIAPFDVGIYGGSAEQVYQLHRDLLGWLDVLAGPEKGAPGSDGNPDRAGFVIGAWKTPPTSMNPGATTWCGVVSITLKALAPRRMFKSTVVLGVDLEVDVTAPDGSGSETFASTEVHP